MDTNLLSIDRAFIQQYQGLLEIQRNTKEQLKAYAFDLSKREITDAIIARMDAFWYFNVTNCKDLGRHVNTTAADFFTETCLFFFKCYFEDKLDLKVFSEKKINDKGKVIRPDISIWNKDETRLIAVIELKVNDGWKRKEMFDHLVNREKQIKIIHPDIFFGVITFWNFFDTNIKGWNSKYMGIKQWNENENHPNTGACVENMIIEIEKRT